MSTAWFSSLTDKAKSIRQIWAAVALQVGSKPHEDGWENRIDRDRYREEVYARAKIGSG